MCDTAQMMQDFRRIIYADPKIAVRNVRFLWLACLSYFAHIFLNYVIEQKDNYHEYFKKVSIGRSFDDFRCWACSLW